MNKSKMALQKPRGLQNEILTKTQIALEAIKNYEARTSYLVAQKNKTKYYMSPHSIGKEIDEQYSRLHEPKEMKLNKTLRVQIFPYNQQYYYIDTKSLIFPVRLFIKDVKNQGILYVGYDLEYPGIERGEQSQIQANQEHRKSYDYKFTFNKDIMCLLKNQKRRSVQKIYLSFVAKKDLVMFNLKFDFIGYESLEPEQEEPFKKRTFTETNIRSDKFMMDLQALQKNMLGSFYSKVFGSQKFGKLQRSITEIQSTSNIRKNRNSLNKLPGQSSPDIIEKKNFLRANFKNVHVHERDKSREISLHKKQKKLLSVERVKANKEQIQDFKQKQFQIKERANKLKKSIENYQKIYKQERVRDKKCIKLMAPFVYLTIFMHKSNRAYNKQARSITKAFTIRYLAKKFTNGLKTKYLQGMSEISSFKIRNQMACLHIFQLAAKIAQPVCKNNAATLIFQALGNLEPALILNHALNQATKYRAAVRLIQKRWILKYKARLTMLESFSNSHVQAMLKEFPHLKMGFGSFKSGNHCHKICYEYMIDESAKFRQIYDAFLKRNQQIEEFIDTNYQIRQYNKGKQESKWKTYLDIPKRPVKPQQRIFRNLDILKAMIRGWFQLEYKKILKRTISGK